MFNLIRAHQQKIALAIGFVAVATVGFWGGLNTNKEDAPKASAGASSINTNYSESTSSTQTQTVETATPVVSESLNCEGKIKGSSSYKYHVPGGAFYTRTTKPIACFDTEAEATGAGFVKSSR